MKVYFMAYDMSIDPYYIAHIGTEGVPEGFANYIEQSVDFHNLLVLSNRKGGRRFNNKTYLKWLEEVLAKYRIEVVWLECKTDCKYHITA